MMMAGEIFIPIAFFASIVLIVYLVIRRKERMAILEKGLSAEIFEKRKQASETLKWGMLLIGIGAGIIIGRILDQATSMGEEASFFSMVFLCGGISLVWYHFLAKKMSSKDRQE